MENKDDTYTQYEPESTGCDIVGNIILIFCIVIAVVYIVVFGQVETIRYSQYSGTIKESNWSFFQILMGISIAISGAIWRYLFQKIGSILRHLEELKSK